MDATGDRPSFTVQNHQNNYIQVNGIMITEEQVKSLPVDKLEKIREIFSGLNSEKPIP